MNWLWIRLEKLVPLLCCSGPAVSALTSEQPSSLSTALHRSIFQYTHVRVVLEQYSFHFSHYFYQLIQYGPWKHLHAWKIPTVRLHRQVRGKEEDVKCWERTADDEMVLCSGFFDSFFLSFCALKSLKSGIFIMWYCWVLKTEWRIEIQRQLDSSLTSHEFTLQSRD